MANTLLTPDIIAEASLPVLYEKVELPQLSFQDYSDEFVNVGDSIKVRTPAELTAAEWDGDSSGDYQDITESSITVNMNSIIEVPVKVTAKEMTLDIYSFQEQVIEPAMEALSQKMNSLGYAELLKYAYQTVGAAGSTPDALSDLSGVNKTLNVALAPRNDRYLSMDYSAEEKFLQLDSLVEVDKSGANQALRDGIIGRVYGLNLISTGSVPTVAADSGFGASATATATAGATSLTIASGTATGTVKAGQLITVDGGIVHSVTADATLDGSGAGTVSVWPAVPSGGYSGADTTITGAHTANIAWQRNALAYVSRPLAPPMGGADASAMMFKGLNIRVVMDYDIDTKSNKLVFDVLSGWKVLRPDNVVRLLG